MMKIPWIQHASNEQILGMVDESCSLLETEKVAEKMTGHVLRHDSLLKKVTTVRLQGNKTAGRPRAMLLDAMMREENEINYAKMKDEARDRETWHH